MHTFAADVTLAWDAAVAADLAGYKIHYGTASRTYSDTITLGNQTTFTVTGLQSGTWYFAVTAFNTAGIESGYSNEVSKSIDATPPTITAIVSSNITDSGATIAWATNEPSDAQVEFGRTTAYGNSTSLDAKLATIHSDSLNGLLANTLYHYRVKSKDMARNLATSADFTFSTLAPKTAIPTFVQNKEFSITSGGSMSVTFPSPNMTGNLLVASIVWDNSGPVSVKDRMGNSYSSAIGPTKRSGNWANAQIFYAKNVAGGSNTVTVYFSTSVTRYGHLSIHEYAGLDPIAPFAGAKADSGTSTLMDSGLLYTTTNNVLLFASGGSNRTVTNPGSGFTARSLTDGRITEDSIAASPGTYGATATQNGSAWIMQLVAFRPAASQVQATTALPLLSQGKNSSAAFPELYLGVALVNTGSEKAVLKFTAIDTAGKAIATANIDNPAVRELWPGEQITTGDKELFGDSLSGSLFDGWIRLDSTSPKIGGYFAMFDQGLTVHKGATISIESPRSIILPEIGEQGNARITVANASSWPGTASMELISADGIIRSSVDRSVEPNGAEVIELSADLFGSVVPATTDYYRVRASEGLQVFELPRKTSGDIEVLNRQDQNTGSKKLYAPRYWLGPYTRSTLAIVNLDSEEGTVAIRIIDEDAYQVGATRILQIAPNGKILLDNPELAQNVTSRNEAQGYLEISSEEVRLTGHVSFPGAGQPKANLSLPLAGILRNSALFSNITQNGIGSATMTLINPADGIVSVKMELYSGDGRIAGVASDVIYPHACRSWPISDSFPGISTRAWTSGYVKVTADQPIAIFSPLASSYSPVFTIIPAQNIP